MRCGSIPINNHSDTYRFSRFIVFFCDADNCGTDNCHWRRNVIKWWGQLNFESIFTAYHCSENN